MRNRDQKQDRMKILGVPISILDMNSAISTINRWVNSGETHYVCATDVHSIMQAQHNPQHMAALANAGMIIPDGTPLIWVSRARGQKDMHRVCGPDLMWNLSRFGTDRGWRHYFYGGAEHVAEAVARNFESKFQGFKIAGTYSPPFHQLSPSERQCVIDNINSSNPHIVWVGLGCPKQEIWMLENASYLKGAVVIGVGAAFDFHANKIPRAPPWMRSNGLEWLHRLFQEPARLWRRYLIMGPQFILRSAAETWRMRRAEAKT